ncbi:MAG: aminotransferase class I/II-fold pyridoxal phosphate-dependent enzyme [Vicinamibacterales bacterium]
MLRTPQRIRAILPAPFDALNAKAAQLRAEGKDVISLGQALPDFGPPTSAVIAAKVAYERPETHVYSANAGLEGLRVALSQRLNADGGTDIRIDELIVSAGGNQAFMLGMMTLVEVGAEVILPAPFFANHEMTVRAIGATPVEAPGLERGSFQVTWASIEPYLSSRTAAVVVCSPSNPTGDVVAREQLAVIQQELARRSITLFIDETYADFVYDDVHTSGTAFSSWRENTVIVSTFSKSFGMTGWRVGYLLANSEVCKQAIKVQDAMIICAPVISQIGVEAAIKAEWRYAHSFHPELKARRQLLIDRIKQIPRFHWAPTSGGFFAFVSVESCNDAEALANDILERVHVVTIPGSSFGKIGQGHLRLSYGAASQPRLAEGLDRLRAYFQDATHGFVG